MTISYDRLADTLYITFFQPLSRAEYLEVPGGILRIDGTTRQIAGITIPFFQEKAESGEQLQLPEIGNVPFNSFTEKAITEASPHRPHAHHGAR